MSDFILLETGDKLLQETGDNFLLEQANIEYAYAGEIDLDLGLAASYFLASTNHLQACTLIFPAKSLGTGTQTITGIVDSNGNAFAGKVFIFHGNAVLNTIEQFFRISTGTDDGILPRSVGIDETQNFGIKTTNGGLSGNDSVFSEHAQFFFGGAIYRTAKISAIRVGEFDLDYSINLLTGDSIIVTVLEIGRAHV